MRGVSQWWPRWHAGVLSWRVSRAHTWPATVRMPRGTWIPSPPLTHGSVRSLVLSHLPCACASAPLPLPLITRTMTRVLRLLRGCQLRGAVACTARSGSPWCRASTFLWTSLRCASSPLTWQECVRAASAQRVGGHSTLSREWVTALSERPRAVAPRTPRILVSGCLVGHVVAYHGRPHLPQGTHAAMSKQNEAILNTPITVLHKVLGELCGFVELVPLCPEVQLLGLGVPRCPLHLAAVSSGVTAVRESQAPGRQLLTVSPESTLTTCFPSSRCTRSATSCSSGPLPRCDGASVAALLETVDGVILKSRSPSCGVGDARLYAATSTSTAKGDESALPRTWSAVDGFFTQLVKRHGARSPPVVITTERQLLVLDPTNAEEDRLVKKQKETRHRREQGQHRGTDDTAPSGLRVHTPETSLMDFLEYAFTHNAARVG